MTGPFACEYGPIVPENGDVHDDEHENPVVDPVAFKNVSPNAGENFALGESVIMQARLEWEGSLHGWDLFLVNTTTGDTVFTADLHDHREELRMEEVWVNTVTELSDMQLIIH